MKNTIIPIGDKAKSICRIERHRFDAQGFNLWEQFHDHGEKGNGYLKVLRNYDGILNCLENAEGKVILIVDSWVRQDREACYAIANICEDKPMDVEIIMLIPVICGFNLSSRDVYLERLIGCRNVNYVEYNFTLGRWKKSAEMHSLIQRLRTYF